MGKVQWSIKKLVLHSINKISEKTILSLKKIIVCDIEINPILINNLLPKLYSQSVPLFSDSGRYREKQKTMIESTRSISYKIYNEIKTKLARKEYLDYVLVPGTTENNKKLIINIYHNINSFIYYKI